MTTPPQFRTMTSHYQQYRAAIREMIIRGIQQPVARVTLALIGTLMLVIILGVLALRPTLVTISQLIKEINKEEQLISLLDTKIKGLQTAQELLAQLEPELPFLTAAIPPTPQLEVFVKEVELLAQKNQLLNLEISQPGFSFKPTAENVIPIVITVGGTETAIRQFIADLNQIDRLVIFQLVNLSAIPPTDRQNNPYPLRGTITLNLIYLKGVSYQ